MSLIGRLLGVGDETKARPVRLDPPMQRVVDALERLEDARPETLPPAQARRQPTLRDAMLKVLGDAPPDHGVGRRDLTVAGAEGELAARLYSPPGAAEGPLPVVLYFHGGGWVLGDLDAYDGGPRGVARLADCLVLACRYRQAPEHRFPAAHEDAWAAWTWLAAHASELGGDAERLAIMGEGAGATLAAATAVRARDENAALPRHMGLICPIASAEMDSESYIRNARARPLSRALMEWYVHHTFEDPGQVADPRVRLVEADLIGLPPASVVCAEVDPLLDDGERLAACLEQSGVDVRHKTFHGSTHDFFGLDALLPDAVVAQRFVADDLKRAFGAPGD